MRFTIMVMMLLNGSVSLGKTHDFNKEIKEASLSQRILHRKLLRILQGSSVAIAANDLTSDLELQSQTGPSPEVAVQLKRVIY